MVSSLRKCFNSIQEIIFSFFVPVDNCLTRVLWELCIFNNELMEIVPKEIGTRISTMTVKYSEKATFRPVFNIFLSWWLHDIKNDTHSIFIIISNDSLICICCISHDESILSDTAFSWFPARQIQWSRIGRWSITE